MIATVRFWPVPVQTGSGSQKIGSNQFTKFKFKQNQLYEKKHE